MIISKAPRKKFRVDMAPLIDVVFLLLIFFMLTFAIQGRGMDINLPKGSTDELNTDKPLVIKIENENSIRIDSDSVPLTMLRDKLNEAVEARHYKAIVIEAGNKARYELFVKVLDVARQAGVKDFSIIREAG